MATVYVKRLAGWARSKFGAKGERIDGQWFASKREAKRWADLQLLVRAGAITGLVRQHRFDLNTLNPDDRLVTIGVYVADFVYRERDLRAGGVTGPPIVEDSKGFKTELYLWKRKHFELQYGFAIRET